MPANDALSDGGDEQGALGSGRSAVSSGRRPKANEPPKPRIPTPQPENAIQAARRLRKGRLAAPQPAGEPRPAEVSSTTSASPQGASDPWTVPQSVRDRFVQDGHRFYFPDGAPAFKDRGRRLSTASENTQVVHSLVEIARSRGWSEVSVSGTERFRQEAWRQARLAGLSVRGYRPDEAERAQLIRAMGRKLPRSDEDAIAAGAESTTAPPASPPAPGRPPAQLTERIQGRLLEFGSDTYRHDPTQQPSYFVRLQTGDGPREVWGKDLERAVTHSLTHPKIGDEVVLQRTGREPVTVQRQARDSSGQTRERSVGAFRNRWALETAEFFNRRAEAAVTVRDPQIPPRDAVKRHPELAGTYLNLRAAELAADTLRATEDRRRFVGLVREALASEIERGEPLQAVRLRERRTPSRRTRGDPEQSPGLGR